MTDEDLSLASSSSRSSANLLAAPSDDEYEEFFPTENKEQDIEDANFQSTIDAKLHPSSVKVMYAGDCTAKLSKEQQDCIINLIPTPSESDVSSVKFNHMFDNKLCVLHDTSYVKISNNNIRLLTPKEIEDFKSPTLNANVREERDINNDTIPLYVVSFCEHQVSIVYGKIPVALSHQQLLEHFEKEVSAKKGERDKKNGEGSNVGKGGENVIEGGTGDESNMMDISLMDETLIDGVGGDGIGIANMSISLDISLDEFEAPEIIPTNGSTAILHRAMHDALDEVASLYDLCLWAKRGIRMGWPISNRKALTYCDVTESPYISSLTSAEYPIAMGIVEQARRLSESKNGQEVDINTVAWAREESLFHFQDRIMESREKMKIYLLNLLQGLSDVDGQVFDEEQLSKVAELVEIQLFEDAKTLEDYRDFNTLEDRLDDVVNDVVVMMNAKIEVEGALKGAREEADMKVLKEQLHAAKAEALGAQKAQRDAERKLHEMNQNLIGTGDDGEEEEEEEEATSTSYTALTQVGWPFNQQMTNLQKNMRNNHGIELDLPFGKVPIYLQTGTTCLYIGRPPGQHSDLPNMEEPCLNPRIKGEKVRIYFLPSIKEIVREAWGVVKGDAKFKANKLQGKLGLPLVRDLLLEEKCQNILREGLDPIQSGKMTQLLFFHIRHGLALESTKSGKTTYPCLCGNPSCSKIRLSVASSFFGFIDEGCIENYLNAKESPLAGGTRSGKSSLSFGLIDDPFSRKSSVRKHASGLFHGSNGMAKPAARLASIFIDTDIEKALIQAADSIKELECNSKKKIKEVDPEKWKEICAKGNAINKKKIQEDKVENMAAVCVKGGYFMPKLSTEKYDETLEIFTDFVEGEIEAAKERGYGILGYICDATMNRNGHPSHLEHLRSIIDDNNPIILQGPEGNGARLGAKDIGSPGEEGILLPIRTCMVPCLGGVESESLERAMQEYFISEFPGIFTNQRLGGPQFVKGDALVVMTIYHWGEGARNGKLALNSTSELRARERLKNNMMYADEECIFIKPGTKKTSREVGTDKGIVRYMKRTPKRITDRA